MLFERKYLISLNPVIPLEDIRKIILQILDVRSVVTPPRINTRRVDTSIKKVMISFINVTTVAQE